MFYLITILLAVIGISLTTLMFALGFASRREMGKGVGALEVITTGGFAAVVWLTFANASAIMSVPYTVIDNTNVITSAQYEIAEPALMFTGFMLAAMCAIYMLGYLIQTAQKAFGNK